MVVDLSKVVAQVPKQVQEHKVCLYDFAAFFHREGFVHVRFGQPGQRFYHNADGLVQAGEQLHARHVFIGKFPVAVAYVARVAQNGADEVVEVAGQVQAEVAGGVADTGFDNP